MHRGASADPLRLKVNSSTSRSSPSNKSGIISRRERSRRRCGDGRIAAGSPLRLSLLHRVCHLLRGRIVSPPEAHHPILALKKIFSGVRGEPGQSHLVDRRRRSPLNALLANDDRGHRLDLVPVHRFEVLRVDRLLHRGVIDIDREAVKIKTARGRHLFQGGSVADIAVFNQEGTEEAEVKGLRGLVSLAPGRLSGLERRNA